VVWPIYQVLTHSSEQVKCLGEVLRVGRSGFLYTSLGITAATVLGLAIGNFMRVGRTSSFLITVGTAICGGSAIAAVGPIVNASEDEMAASLGTVFVLNSVALLFWSTYVF
jgi:uncharacterized membrane protein YadS